MEKIFMWVFFLQIILIIMEILLFMYESLISNNKENKKNVPMKVHVPSPPWTPLKKNIIYFLDQYKES